MAFGFGRDKGSGEVPVVQGVAVNSNNAYVPPHSSYFEAPQPSKAQYRDGGPKGEEQPKQFNDVFFAVAFLAHLCVMLYFFVAAAASGNVDRGNAQSFDYTGVVYCVSVCGLVAAGLSSVALGFMMQFAEGLVKMALFFSLGCSLAIGVLGAISAQPIMAIMGFLSFALGCCYAYFVWGRIPFAAINMKTALTAVKANGGLGIVAYFFLAVAFLWSVGWSVATGGMMAAYGNGVVFLFLVSYYWTHQVIQNTVHVTAAGVIGTWWFVPNEASSFCAPSLWASLARATTYSFGSICFGSLLVAIVQALRQLNHMLHENEDFQIIVCLVDCLLSCIQGIIEYMNKWAYIYVGLYGYSYLEAGQNVMTLFQYKGWTAIITDDLVDNVLVMVSVAIGLCTGLVGLIMASVDQNLFAGIGYDDPGMVGFIIGLLVGFVLASILMSVVGSAVNTVIVCFAEAPNEFRQNHPHLSNEMHAAWRQAWPDEFNG